MHNEIDFSQQVKEILNRNNIQVRSLAMLNNETKQLFLQHRKKAILLIRGKVYEREIDAPDDKTIDIFDSMLNPYLKLGQLVLLVLPADKGRRFVLQTSVKNIFVDRFRLVTLDPRKNQRFPVTGNTPVFFRTVPDSIAIGIQNGELRTIRETAHIVPDDLTHVLKQAGSDVKPEPENDAKLEMGLPDEAMPPKKLLSSDLASQKAQAPVTSPDHINALVHDILYQKNHDQQSPEYVEFKKQTPVQGILQDISLGGMCVTRSNEGNALFSDQLIAVQTSLKIPDDNTTLDLFLFAVVRNVRINNGQLKANLQFLSRMPKAAVQFFPTKENDPSE